MNHEITCCICAKPITLRDVDEKGMKDFKLDRFLESIACVACHEYRTKRRIWKSRLRGLCLKLHQSRFMRDPKARKTREAWEEALRKCLERFQRIVCDHYQQPFEFDEDMAEDLLARPEQVDRLLATYVELVSREVENQDCQHEDSEGILL